MAATAPELMTIGSLTAVCHLIVDLTNELAPLVREPDMESQGWRGEAAGRIVSLRAVVAFEGRLPAIERYTAERADIHAALAELILALDTAALGLARGELAVFLLSMTARANAIHGRLRRALDALTVAVAKNERGTGGFAC